MRRPLLRPFPRGATAVEPYTADANESGQALRVQMISNVSNGTCPFQSPNQMIMFASKKKTRNADFKKRKTARKVYGVRGRRIAHANRDPALSDNRRNGPVNRAGFNPKKPPPPPFKRVKQRKDQLLRRVAWCGAKKAICLAKNSRPVYLSKETNSAHATVLYGSTVRQIKLI